MVKSVPQPMEDMQSKLEVVAEGHLQLVEGQRRLEEGQKRLEERLDFKIDSLELRLSRQIGHISTRVDCIGHSRT